AIRAPDGGRGGPGFELRGDGRDDLWPRRRAPPPVPSVATGSVRGPRGPLWGSHVPHRAPGPVGAASSCRAPRVSGVRVRCSGRARRYVRRVVWCGARSVLVGAASLVRLLYRRPDPGLQLLRLRDVEPASTPSPSPSDEEFDGVAGLEPQVTPNDLFYVV